MPKNKISYPTPKVQEFYRLILAILGSTLLIGLWLSAPTDHWLLAILLGLLAYQAISYAYTSDRRGGQVNTKVAARLAQVDSFIAGLLMALTLIEFSLSCVLGIILIMHLAQKPRSEGLVELLLFSAGVLVGIWLIPAHVVTPPPLLEALFFLILGLYIFLLEFLGFNSFKDLEEQNDSLVRQNEWLSLRIYRLSKYLSPGLRKAILTGKDVRAETQEKFLTVFFSDLEGFTKLAEELHPEDLTQVLNTYLTEMSEIAMRFGGTIDKFIGDAIMVFFGDPNSRGKQQDCMACVCMAIAMRNKLIDLREQLENSGLDSPLEMRIGINSGMCKVGNFGTDNRLDYTLLGREVNLASRMESAAGPGEILISQDTYDLVKDAIACEHKGKVSVKGFAQPVTVYSVLDLKKNQSVEEDLSSRAM